MPVELFIQLRGVTHRVCCQDHQVHAGIQCVEEDFYRRDEIERCGLGHAGGFVDQVTRMSLQRGLVQLDLAIFLQHSLGLACTAGGVNGKTGIAVICPAETRQWLRRQNLVPCCFVNHDAAAAILPDCLDTLRRVGVFHCCKRCTGLPHTQHRDERPRVPGKPDQHEILSTDSFAGKPAVDAAGQFIDLPAGIADVR